MKKILLIAALLVATGCSSVPVDVVECIDVLRDNTHALAKSYGSLLDRAPAPEAPADETEKQKEERLSAWEEKKRHDRVLMSRNNVLADKVSVWAEVSKEDDGAASAEAPKEDSHVDQGS